MKPFILLQTRPEAKAADNEYEAFMKFGDLGPGQLLRHQIHDGQLPKLDLEKISGIFLGGGPYCVSDSPDKKSPGQKRCEAALLKLLDLVIPKDIPFLGACYIGLVIEHQRGLISRKYAEVIGPHQMSKTEIGKKDTVLDGLPSKFIAYSGHKEACELLPETAVNLVSSATCPYQMIRFKNNIYLTQFHPELDEAGLEFRINIYKNYGYFPPDEAATLVSAARARPAVYPVQILQNFVNKYAAKA